MAAVRVNDHPSSSPFTLLLYHARTATSGRKCALQISLTGRKVGEQRCVYAVLVPPLLLLRGYLVARMCISRLGRTVAPSLIESPTVLWIMILPVNGPSCFMSYRQAFHPRFQMFLPLLLHPGRTVEVCEPGKRMDDSAIRLFSYFLCPGMRCCATAQIDAANSHETR